MEDQLQLFQNDEFGALKVLTIDGKPYFPATDCAKVLGYKDAINAIKQHCRGVVKHHLIDSLGRTQQANFIPEGDLYRLIVRSQLPTAERFECWIFDEVLPSIRKYGAYMTDNVLDKMLENPDFAIRLFTELKQERENALALKASIIQLEPKARYYDAILQSTNAVLASVIAKDYGMSTINFNKLLHDLKVQYKAGDTWVLYQQYADYGYMLSRTYLLDDNRSVVRTSWSQKGRLFLYNFLKQRDIVPAIERNSVEQLTLGQQGGYL